MAVSPERVREIQAELHAWSMRNLERLQAGEPIVNEGGPGPYTAEEHRAVSEAIRTEVEARMKIAVGGEVEWSRWQLIGEATSAANKDSDRSVAIVLATVVETRTQAAIERYFDLSDKHKKSVNDSLFNPLRFGALSNASAKNKLAMMLGVYGIRVYETIKVISEVRNAFAHKLEIRSFEDPPIKALVARLNYVDQFLDYREEGLVKLTISQAANGGKVQQGHRLDNNPFETSKGRYQQTCSFLSQLLFQAQPGRPEPDLHAS